jgi:hypothetical protein
MKKEKIKCPICKRRIRKDQLLGIGCEHCIGIEGF